MINLIKNYKLCSNKNCLYFGQFQNFENFSIDSRSKDRLSYNCKNCVKAYRDNNKELYRQHGKQYRENNKTKIKEFREKNKNKASFYQKKYYEKNKQQLDKKSKQYYQNNKEQILKYQKEYSESHKEKILYYKKKYNKIKYNNDVNFRLAEILRSRLHKAIKYNKKIGSAVLDLGCTINEARAYIESTFYFIEQEQQWTTWDNYGKLWHIDHIKPLSLFDLTDRDQFFEACHYTNLRALYWKQNLSEGNRR